MPKKITKSYIKNLTPSQIGQMKSAELRSLLRGMRNLFTQQDKVFKKYEEKVYSPAREKMKDYYNTNGKKTVSKMNVNQMRSEAFKLQDFFNSKTSTLPGARAVEVAEDKRLFGTDKRGRAKYRMNVTERTQMWALIEEYKKLNKHEIFESDIVQQAVASMIQDMGGPLEVNALNLEEIRKRIEEMREESWENEAYYDETDYDVFSGTRPY